MGSMSGLISLRYRHINRRAPWAALLLAAGALGACAQPVVTSGNMLDAERLESVRPGEHTRQDVVDLLGSPSSIGTFRDTKWYYIARQTQTTAFLEPDVLDQQVIVVSFDNTGVVEDVSEIGLDEAREVQPVARTTPTHGNQITVLQQLFGNIGRFNPEKTGK
jgi:outer membrane protein assembly factor BamE (lipoprotein component of BamABCDE complex)